MFIASCKLLTLPIIVRVAEYETKNAIYSNIKANIKIKSKTIKIVRFPY